MSAWPRHGEDEMLAVQRVLASGRVNYWSGDEGRAFEREFAAYHEVPHAVALANGSAALELALRALGVGAGDDVVVTPRSFVASAACVVLGGARPVFADVDPESQNITPETARAVLTPRTRAIVPVHLAGWPCDMDGFRALAQEYGLYLIEDCAQAHGARWRHRPVGSFGDAAAFSFCTDKIMSTGGEGGMLLIAGEDAWRRAWSYKDHGKGWDSFAATDDTPGFRWLHEAFGTNLRLTEMQSAIGRIQLKKLDDWLEQRRANASVLNAAFAGEPVLRLTIPPPSAAHAYYKYYAFVRRERLSAGWTRERIAATLQAKGIACFQGACPEIYREAAFLGAGLGPSARLPVAHRLGATSLMLPIDQTMDEQDMSRVADCVLRVLQRARDG